VSKDGTPALSLGDSRFLVMEIARLKLLVSLRAPDSPGASTRLFSIGFEANGLSVSVKALGLELLGGGDGLRAQTDVRADYVQGEGLRVQGSTGGAPAALGLDFVTPINRSIGGGAAGLTVGSLRTRVEVNSDPPNAGNGTTGLLARVRLSFDAKGRFGPLDIVAEGLGGWFGRWRDSAGALPKYA